ncbi:DUF2334 domain-containing protein [Vibrio brasiliensis]|uniref:DUF2334 domain-containing protein n=1 Tax=Vibrio brasiliensis LMG 20546 TaxID=945543 RepID=E8M055_9VIBR|nr:DUF2334 domain-containing protein [Vibrio brasiliensis]EGA63707.1 hypothetical protein VIBR0546_16476 [Vibrio brasiliensis LMG 20546]
MTIQFVIRDDDLSYFSDIELIERLYQGVWKEFPITFATIPYQKGTIAGHMPLEYWHTNTVFPIGENVALVNYIKSKIKEGRVDLVMHGIHHTYRFDRHKIVPELKEPSPNFAVQLREAKQYLEEVFMTEINTFVPPSNTMSKEVSRELISQGFNLLNLPGVRCNTRSLLSWPHQKSRLERIYYMAKHRFDSPKPIIEGTRWEIGGYALTPSTNLEQLKSAFRYCLTHNLPFVLATHFWEHSCRLPNNNNKLQYDILLEFLDYCYSYDIKPCLARDIIL